MDIDFKRLMKCNEPFFGIVLARRPTLWVGSPSR
jgi:hypothetical protein